ncbi:PEP-CTERM sorting domain-containing protein [Kiritimatiellaeota bacterium B1221]|nr:PEP-CTERM sorting domain-containing protein [Kiritimatiellaeota bacterium B1221]
MNQINQMNQTWKKCVFVGFALFALMVSKVSAEVLYSEDFEGTGDLHGTTPDVRTGNFGTDASATWQARTGPSFSATGGIPSGNKGSALLAFTPVTGQLYELSVDIRGTSSSVDNDDKWLGVGFSQNADLTRDMSANRGYAWMSIVSDPDLGQGNRYGGSNGSNSDAFTFSRTETWVNLKVLLDTRDTNWSASWYVDDVKVTDTFTYTTNPTINWVGYSVQQNSKGVYDNFQLSVIPEPSSLMLVGLALPLLFFFRRTSR